MILVDTSVWVDHFRRGENHLVDLLKEGSVAVHPLVVEELACGNISKREDTLGLLASLPKTPQLSHGEFLEFVERNRLYGLGLGAVDIHLLGSARLALAKLWTKDRVLRQAARRLQVLEGHI